MFSNDLTPNWDLVTDSFTEPTTCRELLELLSPLEPTGDECNIVSLSWKKKHFYEHTNIKLFVDYAREKLPTLPSIDKDHFHLVLRIMRLYRAIEDYESASQLAIQYELVPYIKTSLHFQQWDDLTKYIALSYLLSKYKEGSFDEDDYTIFHRTKFDTHWLSKYNDCFTHGELLALYLWYMRKYGRTMPTPLLEDHLMGISVYINTYFVHMVNHTIAEKYSEWVNMFSQISINKTIMHVHHATTSHLTWISGAHTYLNLDDYCNEIREILLHADTEFLLRYENLIGKMISYIPFYTKYQSQSQLKSFEKLLVLLDNGNEIQEMMVRKYLIPLLIQDWDTLTSYLLKEKQVKLLRYILFTSLLEEDRDYLDSIYEMEQMYIALSNTVSS